MGLVVRLYNVKSKNGFTLGYSTHPKGTFTSVNGAFQSSNVRNYMTSPIIVEGLSFDTEYWFKITDTVTGRYIIENVRTSDSKVFECYDRVDVDVTATPVSCGHWITRTITISEIYPNNASNNRHYNIYTGTTTNFPTTAMVTNQTLPYSYDVTYSNANPTGLVYFFIEHYDGHNLNAANKKQGGYDIKTLNLSNH